MRTVWIIISAARAALAATDSANASRSVFVTGFPLELRKGSALKVIIVFRSKLPYPKRVTFPRQSVEPVDH